MLLAAMVLVALGASMTSRATPTDARQGNPGGEATLGTATSPVVVAVPLAPTAPPTPTPCCIRPLVAPTMPPVANSNRTPVRNAGSPDPNPSTNRFVVVDGESGAVLFEMNGYEPIAPASLTKIMTAILGIEHGNPSEHIKVDVSSKDFQDSTLMGLEPWFDVTLEDILYGLMLPSGNDAAVAIARYVAGDENTFIQLMNQRAAELGLQSTHFANPHGLDAPNHYSSPYDMVVMARYGMQYPLFQKLAAARYHDITGSNIAYTVENLNPILWAYPGADGVKIGYTDDAGRAMVATAERNGHRIYVAFMRSEAGLVPDTVELFDWAFNSFTWPGESAPAGQ